MIGEGVVVSEVVPRAESELGVLLGEGEQTFPLFHIVAEQGEAPSVKDVGGTPYIMYVDGQLDAVLPFRNANEAVSWVPFYFERAEALDDAYRNEDNSS